MRTQRPQLPSTIVARPARKHHQVFPARADQAGEARAFLRAALDGCPAADDITLCLSEMVTNAITHSDSRKPGGTFTVHAEVHEGDYLWIEVADNGGPWQKRRHRDGRSHGLSIVGALASEWGIEGDCRARIVWARFDWPAAHGQTRAERL
jgi:anti-sigma regulatory factor (Ser/Thr protein kinase)